jgi:hypothetical protein
MAKARTTMLMQNGNVKCFEKGTGQPESCLESKLSVCRMNDRPGIERLVKRKPIATN